VLNQGNCGACWAFSAVGAIQGAAVVQGAGNLSLLSQQQLVNCAVQDGCSGANPQQGFQYAMAANLTSSLLLPYDATDGTCQPPAQTILGVKTYTLLSSETEVRVVAAAAAAAAAGGGGGPTPGNHSVATRRSWTPW
jgi:hypothetical protein